jgi:hypothetical protein
MKSINNAKKKLKEDNKFSFYRSCVVWHLEIEINLSEKHMTIDAENSGNRPQSFYICEGISS